MCQVPLNCGALMSKCQHLPSDREGQRAAKGLLPSRAPGLLPQAVTHQTSGLEWELRGRESSSPSSCPNTSRWRALHTTMLEARKGQETGLEEKAKALPEPVLGDSAPARPLGGSHYAGNQMARLAWKACRSFIKKEANGSPVPRMSLLE